MSTNKHNIENIIQVRSDIPFVECLSGNQIYVYENGDGVQFPYVSAQISEPLPSENGQQYIYCIANGAVTEKDIPEFVSVDELRLPDLNTLQQVDNSIATTNQLQSKKPAEFSRNESIITISSDSSITKLSTDSSDDDVVFVTTSYLTNPTDTVTKVTSASKGPSVISSSNDQSIKRRRRKKNTVITPRRNPKRVAQLEKASIDLAMKLSLPSDIFHAKVQKYPSSTRQSCRTTGAIYSPPSPLSAKHWKEWPAEGLFDRPVYNPGDENKENLLSKKQTKRETNLDCPELACLTHSTLHALLMYVGTVKKYVNMWNKNGEILSKTNDVLTDTCKLYCVTNDVKEDDLSSYISSLP